MVGRRECANGDAVVRVAFLTGPLSCPVRKLILSHVTDRVRQCSPWNPQCLLGVWLHRKCSKCTWRVDKREFKEVSVAASVGLWRRHPLGRNSIPTHTSQGLVNLAGAVTAQVVSCDPQEPRRVKRARNRPPHFATRPGCSRLARHPHRLGGTPARGVLLKGINGKVLPELLRLRPSSASREARPPNRRSRGPNLGFRPGSTWIPGPDRV